jgi:beta-glucosidase
MNHDFLWGVATSAFQLEGSPYADWNTWDPEITANPEVTQHYRRYKEDLELLKPLGVNAYRFSVEWSRIQPEEDQWDVHAIDHYQEIVDILRENQIEPMVTLHHFTHPRWFLRTSPWHHESSVPRFLEYVKRVVSSLRGVKYWVTINEPYVLLLGGYLDGCMPPGIRNTSYAIQALRNILIAHQEAYDLIHTELREAQVSVAHNMAVFAPCRAWNPLDRFLSGIAKHFYNHSLLDAFLTGHLRIRFPFIRAIEMDLPIRNKLDFFGVNYYTRVHIRFNPLQKMGVELKYKDMERHGFTDTGWEIHPHGLERVLRYASKLAVPIIITENGIATQDDQKKIRFIKRHVDTVAKCLKAGMDIRGYFYWSLLDNYEWLRGFGARFGLYRVDFDSLDRIPTQAATYYSYLTQRRLLP